MSQDIFDIARGPLHLAIADLLSIEIFEEICLYVNSSNPMQAARLMLLGFFPLSRDNPTPAQRRYTTVGSAKLRGGRHWGVFVFDTAHVATARERLAAQFEQWRYLSSHVARGRLRPLTLRFRNFDFSSGEHLAFFGSPREELMAACASFEVRTSVPERGNQSGTGSTGSAWLNGASPSRQRRRIMDLHNSDFRSSVKNSPLRWLCFDTPDLLRVHIHAGRPHMYVDGGSNNPCLANTFLPFAPRLRFLEVNGTLDAKLFNLAGFPLLEHLSIDAPVDGDMLQVISDNCRLLRFLRASLGVKPGPKDPIYFAELETLVAIDNGVLAAVGGAENSPRLSTIWVEDNQIEETVAIKAFGRASIRTIGPWTGRPGELSRGVVDGLAAHNATNAPSGVTLVLQDMSSSSLWSFVEGWTDEGIWPKAGTINVRNCRISATTALALCDFAKVVITSGGTLIFTGCRAYHSDDRSNMIYDQWKEAALGEGQKVLALYNVRVVIT